MSDVLTLNLVDVGERHGIWQYMFVGVPGIIYVTPGTLLALLGISHRPHDINMTIALEADSSQVSAIIGGKSTEDTNVYKYTAENLSLLVPSWLLWRTLDSKPQRPYYIYLSFGVGTSPEALQQNPIGPTIQTPGPQQIGADLDL